MSYDVVYKYWGISASTPNELTPLLSGSNVIDVVEIIYNFLYQEPRMGLFQMLKSKGIGIIAKQVFHSGLLLGKPLNDMTPSYKNIPLLPEKIFREMMNEIRNFVGSDFDPRRILSFALGFVLMDEFVASALIGTSSIEHLKECVAAYNEIELNEAIYLRLREWYQQ